MGEFLSPVVYSMTTRPLYTFPFISTTLLYEIVFLTIHSFRVHSAASQAVNNLDAQASACLLYTHISIWGIKILRRIYIYYLIINGRKNSTCVLLLTPFRPFYIYIQEDLLFCLRLLSEEIYTRNEWGKKKKKNFLTRG